MDCSDYDYWEKFYGVSRGTHQRLESFALLLKKWQTKINLISKSDVDNLWQRHIVDSAQAIQYIPRGSRIVDLGSGAGFPGIILSILGAGEITLIESDGRKSAFLLEAISTLGLRASVLTKRIEDVSEGGFDVVTARGLTSLKELLPMAFPLMGDGAFCLFHKGKKWAIEIEEAKQEWVFDQTIFESATDKTGVIVKLSAIRKRGHATSQLSPNRS